ncbi:MAG TPA: 3-phosphoshikimate 1-carboxyvinyltransferase [Flavisolibacter sp.]
MKITISPSVIHGSVKAPPSKSLMQRACAAALIRKGDTVLHHPGYSADDVTSLEIIQQLGARVETRGTTVLISSKGISPNTDVIGCGESGLALRMFTSIAAVSPEPLTITGTGTLLLRPQHFFDVILPKLGVECISDNGYLPIRVRGPLQPRNIEVDGSMSSQFLTGLLMAYAAAGAKDVTITVRDLASTPYIALTLQVMAEMGLAVPIVSDYREFYFPRTSVSSFDTNRIRFNVEGDWSAASFLLVAGAVSGHCRVEGLDLFSRQADRTVIQVLMQAGADIRMFENAVEVSKSTLKPFNINATDSPDLFPPLVALAAFCNGTSVIEGADRLVFKESNRAASLVSEFGKMGITVTVLGNTMRVEGGTVHSASVQAHNDHRIAMACAVAALGGTGDVLLEGAESVDKSYPAFWEDMRSLHAAVSLPA